MNVQMGCSQYESNKINKILTKFSAATTLKLSYSCMPNYDEHNQATQPEDH